VSRYSLFQTSDNVSRYSLFFLSLRTTRTMLK
jgi:hypothetical protein